MSTNWLEPADVPCSVCGASVATDLAHARIESLAATVRCAGHDLPPDDPAELREAHRVEIWDRLVAQSGWQRTVRPLEDFRPVARPGWGVNCPTALHEALDAVVAGRPGGLILLGPTGIGKTSAALSIADAAVRRGVWPAGIRIRREQQLLGAVVEAFPTAREALRQAWRTPYRLLIVDDLGAWRGRDEIEEETERLAFWSAVESPRAHAAELAPNPPFVIVTSNIDTPDALHEHLGPRVFSRVKARCPQSVLVGTRDHRTGRDYGKPRSA